MMCWRRRKSRDYFCNWTKNVTNSFSFWVKFNNFFFIDQYFCILSRQFFLNKTMMHEKKLNFKEKKTNLKNVQKTFFKGMQRKSLQKSLILNSPPPPPPPKTFCHKYLRPRFLQWLINETAKNNNRKKLFHHLLPKKNIWFSQLLCTVIRTNKKYRHTE